MPVAAMRDTNGWPRSNCAHRRRPSSNSVAQLRPNYAEKSKPGKDSRLQCHSRSQVEAGFRTMSAYLCMTVAKA